MSIHQGCFDQSLDDNQKECILDGGSKIIDSLNAAMIL